MISLSEEQPTAVRLKHVLQAAVVCFIVSLLVAVTFIARNAGFGASDLRAFLFWSLPFALGVGSINLTKLYGFLHLYLKYLVAIIVGIAMGILWTFIVSGFLGQWFNSFSFPVFSCWAAGSASAMVIAVGTSMKMRKAHFIIEFIIIILICSFAAIGTEPLLRQMANDQYLETIFVEWKPGSNPLSIDGYDKEQWLTENELAKLRNSGITGELFVRGTFISGKGKHVRAVILMQHQVRELVKLAQPNGEDVIYVQHGDTWEKYPSNAPLLNSFMYLDISPNNKKATLYMTDLSTGGREGREAFAW